MCSSVRRTRPEKKERLGNCLRIFSQGATALLFALISLVLVVGAGQATPQIDLERVEDPALKRVLMQAFVLPVVLNLPDLTPDNRRALIDAEVQRFERLLKSLGYLQARVTAVVDPSPDGLVYLRPVPGEQYRVGWIKAVGLPSGLPEEVLATFDALAARYVGKTATGELLEQLETGLVWRLRDASYAAGEVSGIEFQLEPDFRTVGVSVTLVPGEPVQLGEIRLQGSRHADLFAQFATSTLGEGVPYSEAALEQLRDVLEGTALFNEVDVSLSGDMTAAKFAKVDVELVDKVPEPHFFQREIGIGLVLSIVTMVLLVLRECTNAETRWFGRPASPILSSSVVLFYALNIIVLAMIIYYIISV